MTDQKTNTQEVETLFKLGAHLGHKKNRLHPKAKKFLHSMIDGVSVIDLTKTVEMLNTAEKLLAKLGKEEKKILVVATKKVANQFATDLCKTHNVPYMTTKWLPGLLTNFDTIIKNVQKLQTMKDQQANGEWDQFVKHERTKLGKEVSRLEKLYGGLLGLTKRPEALVVLDIKKEKNAIKEAKDNNIEVIAIVDTNSNPDEVKDPIVANDDAPAVVEYLLEKLVKAYAGK